MKNFRIILVLAFLLVGLSAFSQTACNFGTVASQGTVVQTYKFAGGEFGFSQFNLEVLAGDQVTFTDPNGLAVSLVGPNTHSDTYPSTGTTDSFSIQITSLVGTAYFCAPSEAVLPVKLISFTAEISSESTNTVILTWISASTENFSHYEVETSTDGVNFTFLMDVVTESFSVEEIESVVQVNAVEGINYYRLKMVDLDDTFEYSEVINITVGEVDTEEEKIVAYFNSESSLRVEGVEKGQKIQITNIQSGRVIWYAEVKSVDGSVEIPVKNTNRLIAVTVYSSEGISTQKLGRN